MRNLVGIALVAGALVTLSACAPSTAGTSASFPIIASTPLSTNEVKAGTTTFVAVDYPFSAFDIPESELDKVAPIDFTAKDAAGKVGTSSRQVDWFDLKATGAPADWTVKLYSAEVRRQTSDTTSDRGVTTVYYRNYVRFLYSIQVPAGTQAGPASLALTATAFGKSTVLPLRVNVSGEAGKSTN